MASCIRQVDPASEDWAPCLSEERKSVLFLGARLVLGTQRRGGIPPSFFFKGRIPRPMGNPGNRPADAEGPPRPRPIRLPGPGGYLSFVTISIAIEIVIVIEIGIASCRGIEPDPLDFDGDFDFDPSYSGASGGFWPLADSRAESAAATSGHGTCLRIAADFPARDEAASAASAAASTSSCLTPDAEMSQSSILGSTM